MARTEDLDFKKLFKSKSIRLDTMEPIYNALVYFVWFLSCFYTTYLLISLLVNSGKIYEKKKGNLHVTPLVSIIVPAYNEEDSIADTISSLKQVSYPAVEFVILSDGSKDNTPTVVRQNIKDDSRFRFIDIQANIGKAGVLNQGIDIARGVFVACMDADSTVEHDILEKVIPYFENPKVGAVTVSVRVKNPKTLMQKIFDIEFTLGLSLFLKIYSFLDIVSVTPGPFSVYRRDALIKIGKFDCKNLTEDHEIAYRLHIYNYKISHCMDAKVFTILPETFKGLYVQRKRWYSGSLLTLFQHRDYVFFSKKKHFFRYFLMLNYSLIILGLVLFAASIYLGISRFIREFSFYQYTHFNFLDHLSFHFDILTIGQIYLFGTSMFFATIILMLIGIRFAKRKILDNKIGLLGFPFLFFLYQFYWGSAIYSVLLGRRIKWR